MKKMSFVVFCLLFSVYCLLSVAGCKKKEVKTVGERAVNVSIKAAEKKPLRPFVETIGTLNPYEEVIVSAEVDGGLKSVRVDEGTAVSKGMVLAAIDDTDYNLEVKRAEAALRQTEATLANTKLEYQRKEVLYKEELVTKQQFDDVSTRLSLAEAEIERAKATLSLAREKLKKTKMYSPLSGVVKERKVSTGDYVKNGTNLFVIIQNNPLKLNFTVTEKDAGKLKKGQDVTFRVDAFPDKEFEGKVSIIYPSLEERTRTLEVEALVPNPNGLLKPSFFAHVTLYMGAARDTVVVPVTSLLYEAENVKVFVVEGDRAREREVKIGSKYGELMEIIEGLKEGEKVVIVGQQNLSENVKVNIVGSQESAVKKAF
ncbi:MAG: efflux RND transporter periplasmic adaptor subunit [Nitrospirota bacterium]